MNKRCCIVLLSTLFLGCKPEPVKTTSAALPILPLDESISVIDSSLLKDPDRIRTAQNRQQPLLLLSKDKDGRLNWEGGFLEDGGFGIIGGSKRNYTEGPLILGDAPILIAIGAHNCPPCVDELGELMDLARSLRRRFQIRFLFIPADGASRKYALIGSIQRLFAKYNQGQGEAAKLKPFPWMEFRSDSNLSWLDLLEDAAKRSPGPSFKAGEIPALLLLDRCGGVQLVAQGRLTRKMATALESQLEILRKNLSIWPTWLGDLGSKNRDVFTDLKAEELRCPR